MFSHSALPAASLLRWAAEEWGGRVGDRGVREVGGRPRRRVGWWVVGEEEEVAARAGD